MNMNNRLVNWFVPPNIRGQTNVEMARIFVFTHLFGPLIAQPMAIYLYIVTPQIDLPLQVMVVGIYSFIALPFLLKYTGKMRLCGLLSFEGLSAVSLFGTYYYGGFSSPFLPWLIISLMLGFFYLSKNAVLVLSLFGANVSVFLVLLFYKGLPNTVPLQDLHILGWLSIVAATVYMSWMALYYARMIALRSELQHEAERFRATIAELERARAVAEEVSEHRSLFFSKMSHELRTPLNVIIGYSEILMEDAIDDSDDAASQVKDLTRINTAGKHLLSLVSEVLDSEKIANDTHTLELSEFNIAELCDEVVASALPLIEANRNQLEINCSRHQAFVETDRKKLRQMVINLLSNAGKFTTDGVITLHMSVESNFSDRRLHIHVEDTGIGIASDAISKLFETYIQADANISKRFGGTGIGLAITRKFAILLGGEVNVTSEVGKGSRFSIDIPAKLEVKTQKPTGKAEKPTVREAA